MGNSCREYFQNFQDCRAALISHHFLIFYFFKLLIKKFWEDWKEHFFLCVLFATDVDVVVQQQLVLHS